MEDGLYSVRFRTAFGVGSGVVHKSGDRLYGGDTGYAYVGQLKEEGERLEALLRVFQHEPGTDSAFGPLRELSLTLSGSASGNHAVFQGVTSAAPGQKLDVEIRFIHA